LLNHSLVEQADVKIPYSVWTLVTYTVVFGLASMVYWMVLFNVTNFAGSMFVNGMICGLSEGFSGVLSGIIISLTSTRKAFFICCFLIIIGQTFNQYFTTEGSLACYMSLFIGIFGVGGIYNCSFIMMNLNVPTDKVGRVTSFSYCVACFPSALCPYLILLPDPYSYLIMMAFTMCLLNMCVFVLPNDPVTQKTDKEPLDDSFHMNQGKWLNIINEEKIIDTTNAKELA
jgi:hypothetical protein